MQKLQSAPMLEVRDVSETLDAARHQQYRIPGPPDVQLRREPAQEAKADRLKRLAR